MVRLRLIALGLFEGAPLRILHRLTTSLLRVYSLLLDDFLLQCLNWLFVRVRAMLVSSLFEDFLLLVNTASADFFPERLALGTVSLNKLV